MWVRVVRSILLLGVAVPSLAWAQSGMFRSAFSATTNVPPTGLVLGDFGGDGLVDIAVTTPETRIGNSTSGAVTILEGEIRPSGEREFFDAAKIAVDGFPSALIAAPFDDDEIPDLIVADGNGRSIVFLKGLNDSDYFAPPGPPIEVGSLPNGMATEDLNGDGELDLVVANGGSSDSTPGSVSILRGQGDGTFVTVLQFDPSSEEPNQLVKELATELNTQAVALGDLNDDDFIDIVAVNTNSNSLTIFFGEGALSFGNRTTVPIGASPSDIALVDLDGDGALDVITADSFADTDGAVTVRLGNGDGTFQAARAFQAGNTPNGIAVDDLNDDGHLDLVASNGRSSDVSVLLGDGSGDFATARTFVANAEPITVALADMDDDGTIDVVAITKAELGTATLLRNRGGGILNAVEDVLVGVSPSTIASGDMNDDAAPDLVVGTSLGTVEIYAPQSQGGFSSLQSVNVGGSLRSLEVVDLDGDAVLDLAVVDREGERVVVLKGLGGARFSDPLSIPSDPRPTSITSGDFNADGRVDLALTTAGPDGAEPAVARVTTLLQQANGSFAATTPAAVEKTPLFVAAADFNADGRDDVAVANQATNTVSILFSNANGSLRLNQTLNPNDVGQQPTSLTIADLNADGRPDLAIGDFLAGIAAQTIKIFLTGADSLLTPLGRGLSAGTALSGIVARDFTGDALYDIIAVQQTANQVTLFRDRGEGRGFVSLAGDNVSRQPINITVADFDGDGLYDAATGNGDPSANNISVLTNCARDQDCPSSSTFPGAAALRGDGNGDFVVSAADLVAVTREVSDADSKRVEDIARPESTGYQASAGVDANGDGRVDPQDRTAVVRRLFAS